MATPCLLQVQPRAVVKGQPPSVPSWGSTPFQSSGLILEAGTVQAPQCGEGKGWFYIQEKGYSQQGVWPFPSDHKGVLKVSFACLSHNK